MAEFQIATNIKRKTVEIEPDFNWEVVDQGIQAIFNDRMLSQSQSYWKLYSFAVNYCNYNHNLNIFEYLELYIRIASNFEYHVRLIEQESRNIPDDELLQFYVHSWQNYQRSTQQIDNMYDHMNRFMIRQNLDKNMPEINQMAMWIWKRNMLPLIEERIVKELWKIIEKERCGEDVDTKIVASIVKSFVALGLKRENALNTGENLTVYKTIFEDYFIQETRKFYTKENYICDKNSISRFYSEVETRVLQEENRVRNYLHGITRTPVLKICDEFLIETQVETLLENFGNLLQEENYDGIPLIIHLVSRIPDNIEKFHAKFENYIQKCGNSEIKKCGIEVLNNPKLYIETVLKVYNKFFHVLSTNFSNSVGFAKSFYSACGKFVNCNCVTQTTNTRSGTIAELVAKYCDSVLKKNSKIEIGDVEEVLSDIIIVFKCIDDKDIFQKVYAQLLAKRLLNHTSLSIEVEASMINKLKSACGMEYTSKFHQMYKDVGESENLNAEFQEHLVNSNQELDHDFSVKILSTGSWPFHKSFDLSLPPELATNLQNFESFYKSKFTGRKLNWLYQLSRGELVANCFETKYTFQVSTFQMAVLLQFNSTDSLSFQRLEEVTKVKLEYLLQVVQTLLKSKLLTCDSNVTDIKPASIIRLRLDYKCKKRRINLNVAPLKLEEKSEQKAIQKYVEKERILLTQAAIVRIMKTEGELQHQKLLDKVVDHLSSLFKPKIVDIKKCVELLVEKEYLERNHDEKDVYRYVK